jgi:hypothetical protein
LLSEIFSEKNDSPSDKNSAKGLQECGKMSVTDEKGLTNSDLALRRVG